MSSTEPVFVARYRTPITAPPQGYATRAQIQAWIDQIKQELPTQNPMPYFVHNNPLQYWEQWPVDEGMPRAVIAYENTGFYMSRRKRRTMEDLLVPFISALMDQGISLWNPLEGSALWPAFWEYINSTLIFSNPVLKRLKTAGVWARDRDPLSLIALFVNERVSRVKVPTNEDTLQSMSPQERYLRGIVFMCKGWSGMLNNLNKNPELSPFRRLQLDLESWIAILAVTEWHVDANDLSFSQAAVRVRQDQVVEELNKIREETRSLREELLGKISEIPPTTLISEDTAREFQFLFCLDDREEAIRRHLERLHPDFETFGTLGFFGVDVTLKGIHDDIGFAHCPPVIQPRASGTVVRETDQMSRRAMTLAYIGEWRRWLNESRFSLFEPVLALLAPLFVPLLLLTYSSPRFLDWLRTILNGRTFQREKVRFDWNRGYSLEQKADIVQSLLGPLGIKDHWARWVVLVGHQSEMANNPFVKAYGCGACGGQSGRHNAQVFCQFVNDPLVRAVLRNRGLVIPESTSFIPAVHDLCSERFELSHLPQRIFTDSERQALQQMREKVQEAVVASEAEKFELFLGRRKSGMARGRSSDWSEPRPEFGHSRVAFAIFGPRSLSRSLNLERRSFLVSYEPSADPDGRHLKYALMNALPVCANINLDYFTSAAFPRAFGSGTKVNMNVAAGLGLTSGTKSDLKIGLPKQMVDYHQPRLLSAIIFARKDQLLSVLRDGPRLAKLVENGWIHCTRIDPDTGAKEEIRWVNTIQGTDSDRQAITAL